MNTNTFKLADFGETDKYTKRYIKCESPEEWNELCKGSPKFMDPLLFKAFRIFYKEDKNVEFDEEESGFDFEKSEVYSLALTILCMMISRSKFKKLDTHDYEEIKEALLSCSDDYPFLSKLLKKMLKPR